MCIIQKCTFFRTPSSSRLGQTVIPFHIPHFQILVPRCDTASRLKLTRSDFENHILRPKYETTSSFGGGRGGRGGAGGGAEDVDGGGTVFVSANNKVSDQLKRGGGGRCWSHAIFTDFFIITFFFMYPFWVTDMRTCPTLCGCTWGTTNLIPRPLLA